jgi:hypothetical protein
VNRNRPVPDVCSAVVEKAAIEAHKNGHAVAEHALADGSVRLTVTVGGGA